MQSTFTGIEIGRRSLLAHRRALSTVGHNLSNANSEGYSRQRVELSAYHSITRPSLARADRPGMLGQGVEATAIERVRDQLLEGRILTQAGHETYWEERDKYSLMVDQLHNEPGDQSVRGMLDRFWEAWQELSLHPDQRAPREAVVERGQTVVETIRERYNELSRIRTSLEEEIRGSVNQINDLTREIAQLNRRIVKSEAAGDNPNDLYDRRDLLVEELAGHVDIAVDDRDPLEFNLYVGGRVIVQGGTAKGFDLEADPQNNGFSRVLWSRSGDEVELRSGKLAAFLELRDQDLVDEIQSLDNMAMNLVDAVNEVHRDGYGLNGETGNDFFVELPFVENTLGTLDRSGDGELDSSYLFRVTGTNELNPDQQIGLDGTLTLSGPENTVEVEYAPTDTVDEVVRRINNSEAEVVARLDRHGRLSMKGTPAAVRDNPDFVIRHVEDSGQFLVGYAGLLPESGPDGAYSWNVPDAVDDLRDDVEFAVAPRANPSGWIGINPTVEREPANVAGGFARGTRDGEVGDGAAAEEIAALRHRPVMVGNMATFDDYFSEAATAAGLRSEQAQQSFRTHEDLAKDLRDWRQSISGVNMDEELSEMIKFQHGYQAAARYVTQVNEMLDTIINRMGV